MRMEMKTENGYGLRQYTVSIMGLNVGHEHFPIRFYLL